MKKLFVVLALFSGACFSAESSRLKSLGDFQCRYVIKKLLHDPESAEFVGNYAFATTKKGFHYQYRIRAKNGFNATRLGLFNCFTETLSDTDLHVVKVDQQN